MPTNKMIQRESGLNDDNIVAWKMNLYNKEYIKKDALHYLTDKGVLWVKYGSNSVYIIENWISITAILLSVISLSLSVIALLKSD
ncbi:MAG: hypothetical protein ACHQFW_06035 [Chitinophagales bacterium]